MTATKSYRRAVATLRPSMARAKAVQAHVAEMREYAIKAVDILLADSGQSLREVYADQKAREPNEFRRYVTAELLHRLRKAS